MSHAGQRSLNSRVIARRADEDYHSRVIARRADEDCHSLLMSGVGRKIARDRVRPAVDRILSARA